MKKSFLLLFASFFIAIAAFSQAKYYKCEGTEGGTTYLFKGWMKLDIHGQMADGRIAWTVITADAKDAAYYSSRMNKSGIEIIEGEYDPKTKDLKFAGQSKIDPDSVIGLDEYTLKISSDNKAIFGKTDSNGTKAGFFYATLQDPVVGKKEYELVVGRVK